MSQTFRLFLVYIALLFAPLTSKALDLMTCVNPDGDVSFWFTSCVRSNFSTLEAHYGVSLEGCYNLPDHVTDAWVDCINNNFQKLAATSKIALAYCENPGWTLTLSSFPSCVRSNFSQLE